MRVTSIFRYFGFTFYCPICRSHLRKMLPEGVRPRPNARCPVCGSLERHRLVFLFLKQKTDQFTRNNRIRMLHVAPEDCLRRIFEAVRSISYFTADLSAVAMTRLDLKSIAFPDNTFDVVYASHVFEHIEDDRAAMREVLRILKKGGWAILQVPILRETTFEDPKITSPEGRLQAFGQQDHVRIYGLDYYKRLEDAGFQVSRERLSIQEDPRQVRKMSLIANEEICFCLKP